METRSKQVLVRLTKKEEDNLEKWAKFWGMNVPQFIRWALFYKDKVPDERMTEALESIRTCAKA